MVTVVIGGDVVPGRENLSFFESGDAKAVFGDLLAEFESSDLTLVNLECPLIEKKSPIRKSGPILGANTDSVQGLVNGSIDIVNLANNHILDHGLNGIENTLKACKIENIATVGAGMNLTEARRILSKEVRGIRIGFLGVAEHEFSIAGKNSAGANPLDLIDFVRNVQRARSGIDYLIVLFHGGNELYPFPSPRLRDTCRFMIEMGANAVIVQHSHCPGSYEEYLNGHIVYGQGNLIFDWPGETAAFYQGFLVRLVIGEDFTSTMEIIPYRQSDGVVGARKMAKEAEQLFRDALNERSRGVSDDAFVQERWLEFCRNVSNGYMSRALGHNRLLSKLNQNGFIVKHLKKRRSLTVLKNLITCEAHREVLETILGDQAI